MAYNPHRWENRWALTKLAGSRNFKILTINRDDIMSLTPEVAQVSGLPYVMDVRIEEAEKIING